MRIARRFASVVTGFLHPEVALEADVFEASHTYRLKGLDKYLTVIEAGQSGKRYYTVDGGQPTVTRCNLRLTTEF